MEAENALVVSDQDNLPTAVNGTLFRTDSPREIVSRASEMATALAAVIKKQKLTTTISGREHVRVEGWTLLGTMLGVFPVCVWTRPLENGWEARVEARTLGGSVIGAAEAACLRSEKTWSNRDDYALRSMAQTRATSKALRLPLGFVVAMAGYETTPAEEMEVATTRPAESKPKPRASSGGDKSDTASEIFAAKKRLENIVGDGAAEIWKRVCREAGLVKGVRLYVSKARPLAEGERMASDAEKVALLAGLNHAINQQQPPSEGAFLTEDETRQLDEKIADAARLSDVPPEAVLAAMLRGNGIARRADVTSEQVPALLAWIEDYDPFVDGDDVPKAAVA